MFCARRHAGKGSGKGVALVFNYNNGRPLASERLVFAMHASTFYWRETTTKECDGLKE